MDEEIIKRFNSIVTLNDTTYHIGDFTLRTTQEALAYINQLNGNHIFIKGSHDYWMGKRDYSVRIETTINIGGNKQKVVMDHYPMESWRWSYHGSYQLHGHWHFKGNTKRNRLNVCVDNTDFYPLSFSQVSELINQNINHLEPGDYETINYSKY